MRGGFGSGACSFTSLRGASPTPAPCLCPLPITSSALVNPLRVRSRAVPESCERKPGLTTPSDAENETSLILLLVLDESCGTSSRRPPTVDRKARPVDEPGFVGSEIAHHRGYLIRLSQAPDVLPRAQFRAGLFLGVFVK